MLSLRRPVVVAVLLALSLLPRLVAEEITSTARPPRPSELIRLLPRRTPTPNQPPVEMRGPLEKFFNTLKTGDASKAYDELLINTRLAERKDNVRLLIEKTDQAAALYGKVLNFEIFDNYSVGSSMIVLTYVSMQQMQPLRWRFIYYKPDKNWVLIDLRVDDTLDDLIE
jgi:hypothetical protein